MNGFLKSFSFWWCFLIMALLGYDLAQNKVTGIVEYFLIFGVMYFGMRTGQIIISTYVSGEIEKITKHYRKT